jgi:hypothetical protein
MTQHMGVTENQQSVVFGSDIPTVARLNASGKVLFKLVLLSLIRHHCPKVTRFERCVSQYTRSLVVVFFSPPRCAQPLPWPPK